MLDKFKHIHFLGIGGSGISAIAYLTITNHIKVSGSDLSKNENTQSLEKEGCLIYIGHKKDNLKQTVDCLIYSEAIDKKTNPEYLEAKKRKVTILSYSEALGMISKTKKTIAVTGTHGKTTTTAMLGQALIKAKEDPTVIVGSRVSAFEGKNIYIGKGKYFVVEACEYRRSFLNLEPFAVIILNCELDHLDYYTNENDYISAFEELVKKIPKEGFLVYNATDKNCQKISQSCKRKKFGIHPSKKGEKITKAIGDFNQFNALHALEACKNLTKNEKEAKKGLMEFSGTSRRMEIKTEKDGIIIMDDYAHHPSEIKATLHALKKEYPKKRIICIFQPHQYSRTHELLKDFKTAFHDADKVIIPNIYEARDSEEDKAKISAKQLVKEISKNHSDCKWGESLEKTIENIKTTMKKGDLILSMGAGDVYKITDALLK